MAAANQIFILCNVYSDLILKNWVLSQEKNSNTHVYAILKSIVKNMSEMKFCTFQGGKWPSY